MAKIKIIAHGANSLEKIKTAFQDGADLVEIDVSKQVFTSRFVAQHQGVLGKFGIGENLEKILTKIPQEKIIFDIKHPQFTPSFAEKFAELLEKFNFDKAQISSDNWPVLRKFAANKNYQAFFLVENHKNLKKLFEINQNNNNWGIVVSQQFLSQIRLASLRKKTQILTGPINEIKELKRACKLGVEGVITDEVTKLAEFLQRKRT